MSKSPYPINQAIAECVQHFRDRDNLRPSHCDVRCWINDRLEWAERAGLRVNHGYSQDRAFRVVRRSLLHG